MKEKKEKEIGASLLPSPTPNVCAERERPPVTQSVMRFTARAPTVAPADPFKPRIGTSAAPVPVVGRTDETLAFWRGDPN